LKNPLGQQNTNKNPLSGELDKTNPVEKGVTHIRKTMSTKRIHLQHRIKQ
jgi:hypothetical protein